MNAQDVYPPGVIPWCDICRAACRGHVLSYHCPVHKNSPLHPGGYDVCKECALKANSGNPSAPAATIMYVDQFGNPVNPPAQANVQYVNQFGQPIPPIPIPVNPPATQGYPGQQQTNRQPQASAPQEDLPGYSE